MSNLTTYIIGSKIIRVEQSFLKERKRQNKHFLIMYLSKLYNI